MGEPNILLRTRGTRESGWESLTRCVALENQLGGLWPAARVTVFAEGDHRVQDWLYARVRDLVGLRPGVTNDDDMSARSLRRRADLVLMDFPENPGVDRCRAWLADADQVIVRAASPGASEAGCEVLGWRWTHGCTKPAEITTGMADGRLSDLDPGDLLLADPLAFACALLATPDEQPAAAVAGPARDRAAPVALHGVQAR